MPHDLLKSLATHRITDTLLPSTMVKLLASRFARIEGYELGSLRTLWYGGESCPAAVIRHIKAKIPQLRFIHGYGPTEATHTATWFIFDAVPEGTKEFLPIGNPLPTVEAFALNETGLPIAPGESGELMLAGVQIMSGYWNDPEKTREVLVPHPAGPGKAYRTGDFVTRDEAGNFIFLERRDDLIKSGGHLIHLSEITRNLMERPGLEDAFVTAVKDEILGKRIIAFVFGAPAGSEDPSGIRGFLGARLPHYMIPHEFHFLASEEIPRNPNGKLDREKLLAIAAIPPA